MISPADSTRLIRAKIPSRVSKAYKSILDVQEPVDMAIIIVPAKAVEAAIADCCAKGVKYVVVEACGIRRKRRRRKTGAGKN